eukprot:3908293-Rhodomonas_salina.1
MMTTRILPPGWGWTITLDSFRSRCAMPSMCTASIPARICAIRSLQTGNGRGASSSSLNVDPGSTISITSTTAPPMLMTPLSKSCTTFSCLMCCRR